MRFKFLIPVLTVLFFKSAASGAHVETYSRNIYYKKSSVKKLVKARPLLYSLVCHGESDGTPLLKRKFKSKGVKECMVQIETPDLSGFFFPYVIALSTGIPEYLKPSLLHTFQRGPPCLG